MQGSLPYHRADAINDGLAGHAVSPTWVLALHYPDSRIGLTNGLSV